MPQSDKANPQDPAGSTQEPQKDRTGGRTDEPTVSEPGGFKNDPDDATNPNEAIERHRRKLRP